MCNMWQRIIKKSRKRKTKDCLEKWDLNPEKKTEKKTKIKTEKIILNTLASVLFSFWPF